MEVLTCKKLDRRWFACLSSGCLKNILLVHCFDLGLLGMFAILAQFRTSILHYGDEKTKYSDAPGEDYLFNSEGNNTENKLKSLGVNVSSWGFLPSDQ
mmetsp:Transcript_7401/g.25311  ORF Transcript_7401/g.25311 Transcript_7401/m.25311 type:complete len:98 (+) Transcript_7401:190-483(+)